MNWFIWFILHTSTQMLFHGVNLIAILSSLRTGGRIFFIEYYFEEAQKNMSKEKSDFTRLPKTNISLMDSTCGSPELISHWTKHTNHQKRTSRDPSAHIHQFVGGECNSVSLSMATTLGSNVSPSQNTFESMIFLFPFGGICDRSLEGTFVTLRRVGGLYHPGVTPFQKLFQVLVEGGRKHTITQVAVYTAYIPGILWIIMVHFAFLGGYIIPTTYRTYQNQNSLLTFFRQASK